MTTKKETQKKDICFTIMPFGGWLDNYYNEIYSVAIKNAGLEPKRADDLYRPSNIVNDIWEYTKKAKIILADLTGKNPNVFYELGLAHAIAKPAILLTQSMDDIPFDLRSLRIIVYDKNSPNWGLEVQAKIESAIKEIIESPEESIPPTFLDVKNVKKTEVTSTDKELLKLKSDINSLKQEIRSSNLRTTLGLQNRNPNADIISEIRGWLSSNIPQSAVIREFVNKRGLLLSFVKAIILDYDKGGNEYLKTTFPYE